MPYTPKVKICGITNAEDAATAVDAGADALGFVFYRKSPRYIEPTLARQIIMSVPPLVIPVGVFVNEDQQVVRNLMDDCGLTLAQLHGNESAIYCKELGRTVLKALRVKDRKLSRLGGVSRAGQCSRVRAGRFSPIRPMEALDR